MNTDQKKSKDIFTPRFASLSLARKRQDELAEMAIVDATRLDEDGDVDAARDFIERCCRAEGDWDDRLRRMGRRLFESWNGDGFPCWGYLSELREVTDWIAFEERRQVAELVPHGTCVGRDW